MTHCADSSRQQAGFTLIELLVSMTILALVMGLVALSAQVMSNGWARAGSAAGQQDMIGRATSVLRRDLDSANRIVIKHQGAFEFLFQGTSEGMTFVSRQPPYPTEGGLYLIRLKVRRDADGRYDLVRSRRIFQAEAARGMFQINSDFDNAVVLMSMLSTIEFSYRGGRVADRWQPDWGDARRMPAAIRIRFGASGNGGREREFITRLQIDAEAGCLGGSQPACTLQNDGELPKTLPKATETAKGTSSEDDKLGPASGRPQRSEGTQ